MEERFVYRKPWIGKAKAAVVLDGDIRVEHRLLTTPISISFETVASAVRISEVDDELPLLRRNVRIFNLVPEWTDANVVMVFKSPVHVERLTLNADVFLSISTRERRRGLDMDALGVRVEQPDGLLAALAHRGVPSLPTVAVALRDVVGESSGTEAVERRHELTKGRAWAPLLTLVCLGVLWTMGAAERLARSGDAEIIRSATVQGVVASSLAWGALMALLLHLAASGRGGSRPIRDRVRGLRALGYLAGIVVLLAVPLVVAGWMAGHHGTPRTLAYGLAGGIPGGVVWGSMLWIIRSPAPG